MKKEILDPGILWLINSNPGFKYIMRRFFRHLKEYSDSDACYSEFIVSKLKPISFFLPPHRQSSLLCVNVCSDSLLNASAGNPLPAREQMAV